MTRALVTTLLLLPLLACQPKQAPPSERGSEVAPATQAVAKQGEGTQTIAAAGVELRLPASWTLVPDREPDFALIRGPGDEPPMCVIERRRQSLAAGQQRDGEDYRRGTLRGRVQQLPGASESEAAVIHCMAPRARAWAAIEAGFASLSSTAMTPLATPANDGPIVELCTGSPVARTHVCVRRRDGAVFCGASDGDTLARVPELEPSVQIGCDGMRACSRSAAGAISCWTATEGLVPPPTVLASVGAARDLAGNCIADADGKLVCREHTTGGQTTERFTQVDPLGDPAHALTGVDQVLAGSTQDRGCVLASGRLRCWDRGDELALSLPDTTAPHELEIPAQASDLARIGGRVCVAAGQQWTCIDADRRVVLDDCQRHSCGCSLVGSARLSCEHEPYRKPDAPLFGRLADVVVADGACAGLRDGTLVCRGTATGKPDDPRITELLIGGTTGVLHELRLAE